MLACSVLVQNGFSNSRLSADSQFTFRFSRSVYNRHALTRITHPQLCKALNANEWRRGDHADNLIDCVVQL